MVGVKLSVHFEVAPLVELVAEVRWQTAPVDAQQFSVGNGTAFNFTVQTNSGASDANATNFAKALEVHGYRNSERVIPQGVAGLPGQITHRFRKNAGDSVVVQVGLGLLTVNAVPPYSSWERFGPQVLDVLKTVAPVLEATQAGPVTSATVRYIDVFDERFRRGVPGSQFIEEVLGFRITGKTKLNLLKNTGTSNHVSFQLAFTADSGLQVQLIVTEGQAGPAQGVILDTTAGRFGEIPPEADALFSELDTAHLLIHDLFVELTQDIRDVMRPVEA